MRIAVIADDLTGANDTGVQFARKGLTTSVLMDFGKDPLPKADTIVIDTDSRSLTEKEAYERVFQAVQAIKHHHFNIIYKKIDSTLRGNVGSELDAIYDVLKPDFILVSPAYPELNRTVLGGCLYVDGQLLHETQFAKDPKTPVTESFIPRLIEQHSKYKAELLTKADVKEHLAEKLVKWKKSGVSYLVFDAEDETDLKTIVEQVSKTSFSIVWSGSAGLAAQLAKGQKTADEPNAVLPDQPYPVLLVVGSVNQANEAQVTTLLSDPLVTGITVYPHRFLENEASRQSEIQRILQEASLACKENGHLMLFTLHEESEVKKANLFGQLHGKTPTEVSDEISTILGLITARLIKEFQFGRIFLTGGDTAKKACSAIGIQQFHLIDEIEAGLPLGVFVGKNNEKLFGITKAGGFGTDQSILHSLKALQNIQ